ncbi:hypothetical protein XX58_000740 [Salmonella enterica subsp. salamae]|uniref:KAP NTPase domain-containing protein n=2 Tax=Salmonella enterica TaxID=28901 RepID=A0A603KRV0_SALER|nr:hypothetical protein [Salmonella enterica subsp. salamae]EAM3921198.1 hypothetical protein [Salmonella enterica]EBP3807276.1 hypothetical protein [Salmonella enterica subsp. enterica]EDX4957670.1 hypothetical protein [Salmonella enterica subsp. salamae serovar 58:l,z13,z28:z6]EAO1722149.1 hypothetical protein [Salmonella enterica]
MADIIKILDAFLQSDNKVLVIKGDWGVGKTFLWNKYYNENKNNLNQVAYSYISLFGKNSLPDLKKDVFHSATAIKKDKVESSFIHQTEVASGIYSYIPWLNPKEETVHKIPFLKPFMKYADNIPLLFRATNAIANLEYSLINNYLICFDDLERRGNGLSIKEIMGFIDELAQRKNCKIVLIFNEESLDNERDRYTFNSYREKIVDFELKYDPSVEKNFNHIFFKNDIEYEHILYLLNKFSIKNVRFLRKLRQLLLTFDNFLKSADAYVKREFVSHAFILCYGYYLSLDELPYEQLKINLRDGPWFSLSTQADGQDTTADKAFRNLRNTISIHPSEFDFFIDFYIQNGYISSEKDLQDLIRAKNREIELHRLNNKITNIWSMYHDSLSSNEDEFIDELKSVIENESTNIPLSEFDEIICILKDFEIDCTSYIDAYFLEIHNKIDITDKRFSYRLRKIRDTDIKSRLAEKARLLKKYECNISAVAKKLAESNSFNPEDIHYLSSLSVDDFVRWMRERGNGVVDEIREGLFMLQGMPGDDSVYEQITLKVKEALVIIASESKINYLRVKNMFNIDIHEQNDIKKKSNNVDTTINN